MSGFIRKSAVKEELDGKRVQSDVYEALEGEVEYLLEQAEKRAEENGRQTVMARDV